MFRLLPVERPRLLHCYTRAYIDHMINNVVRITPVILLERMQINNIINNER